MSPVWITLWFSSMSLMGPATHYYIPNNVYQAVEDYNTVAVTESTTSAGNYIKSFSDNLIIELNNASTDTITDMQELIDWPRSEVYRVTEQIILQNSSGTVIFLGTRFQAPFQWMVTTEFDRDPDYFWIVENSSINHDNITQFPGFYDVTPWIDFVKDETISYGGSESGRISIDTFPYVAIGGQEVNIATNTVYLLDGYIRHEICMCGYGAYGKVDWKSSTGALISEEFFYPYHVGDSDWVHFSTPVTSPANATTAFIEFGILNSTGTVWADLVNMIPLYENVVMNYDIVPPPPHITHRNFNVYTDTTTFIDDTLARANETNEKYILYRGEKFIAKDNYEFSFRRALLP